MKLISWKLGLLLLLFNVIIPKSKAQEMAKLTKQERSLAGIAATTAAGK